MQALRRKIELSARRSDLSSAERPVAEEAVPSEKTVVEEADPFEKTVAEEAVLFGKTVAEGAGSGKAAGFAEGIQCTVAVVARLESFAAVLGLDILYTEVGVDRHQSQ